MQLFKKTISLNQAAKISGYAQDYLGYLIRNGELKGIKKGGIWFTTEGEIKSYISKQKSLHKKSNIKNPSSPVLARNISVYILVIIVLVSSFGFYLFGKYNNQVRTFATTSIITTKHFAVDSFNTTKNFAVASLNTTKNLSDKFAHSTLDSWNGSIATSKELGGELLASASSSGISIKEFGISIWNGITSGVNSFLALFSNKDATTPQINIPKSLVNTKVTPKISQTPSVPLSGETNTTPKVASSVVNNITQQQRTTYINQYDPSIIPRIQGIEKALTNEIAFNSLQVDRIYYSLGRSISSSSDNITEDGTLNDTTLNRPKLNNAVITSSTFSGTTGTYTGNISALTWNNLTITDNGTNTLNIATGKTLAVTQTLTLSGTDSTVMTFPTTSATIARTDASNTFTGHQTIEGVTSTGATGTGRFVFDNTPTLITPVLGIANGTSLALGGATIGTDALGVTGTTSLNGNLTVTGTAWTVTPTISGLATFTSGITSNGVATFNNNISQVGAYTFGTGTGDVSLNGATTANTFSSSGATITGGTINNSTIGITTPVAGNFTTIGVTSQGTGAFTILNISGQLTSTLATGTSPLAVTSTTLNTNLNADLLDGQHGEYYAAASNISGTLNYVSKFTGTGSTIGDSLIFDNGTNVGIGTTDPTYLLHLESATTPKIAIKNTANDSVGIHIAHDTEGTPQWGTIGFNGANDYFQISNSASFSVAHLVIDSTGNVGIGTTGPGAKLDVSSGFYNPASGPSALSIGADLNATSQTDNTRKIATVITPSYHSGDTQAVNILWVDNNVTTNDLFIGGGNGYRTAPTRIGFWTAPDVTTTGGTERLTILGTGNVGIGTTNPTGTKLEVSGAFGTNATALKITNTDAVTGGVARLDFNPTNTLSGSSLSRIEGIGVAGNNTASALAFSTQPQVALGGALTERMRIDENGSLGIGTTNPLNKLHVEGTGGGAAGIYINSAAPASGTYTLYNNGGILYWNGNLLSTGSSSALSGSGIANYLSKWTSDSVIGTSSIYDNGTNVGIGTTSPLSKLGITGNASIGATYGAIVAPTSGMIIEGNVGIGTTNPVRNLDIIGTFGVRPTGSGYPLLSGGLSSSWSVVHGGSNWGLTVARNTADAGYSNFGFFRTRSTDVSVNVPVQNGDGIGRFTWQAVAPDNNAYEVAGLYAQVAGTPSGANIPVSWYLQTGGVARLFVDPSGNVGIGTTTPGAKLHIGVVVAANTSQALKITGVSGGVDYGAVLTGGFDSTGSGFTKLANWNGSEVGYIYINPNGNVGIGTTSPNYKLSVQNDVAGGGALASFINSTVSDTNYSQLFLGKAISTNNLATISYVLNATAALSTLRLGLYGSSDTLSINGNGNVGIGTTGPAEKLNVNGNILSSGTASAFLWYNNNITTTKAWGIGNPSWGGASGGSDGSMVFSTFNGSAWSQRMIVDNTNGNVGIGTTGPGAKLHVYQNTANDVIGQVENAYSGYAANLVTTANSNYSAYRSIGTGQIWSTGQYSSANYTVRDITGATIPFTIEQAAATNALYIKSNGNVGIGTTGPGAKLDVYKLNPNTTDHSANLLLTSDYGSATAGGFGGALAFIDRTTGNLLIESARIETQQNADSNAASLLFYTNIGGGGSAWDTEKMRITSGGNVGIGTVSPGTRLTVNFANLSSGTQKNEVVLNSLSSGGAVGYGALTGFTFNNRTVEYSAGGLLSTAGVYGVNLDNSIYGRFMGLAFYTSAIDAAATEKMRILENGNVGIGTTAPGATLDVNGNVRFATGSSTEGDVTGTVFIGGDLSRNIDGRYSTAIKTINTAGAPQLLQPRMGFFTQDNSTYLPSGLIERMSILANNGNVGIGTVAPNGALEIQNIEPGLDYAGMLTLIDKSALAANIGSRIVLGSTYTSIGGITGGASIGVSKENDVDGNYAYSLAFGTRINGSSISEKMRITSNGNVGIGTTAPSGLLDVSGMANGNGSHFTGTSGRNDPILTVESTGVSGGSVGYDVGLLVNVSASNIGTSLFNVKYGGVSKLFVEGQTGNVGIGTTGPNRTLAVMNGGGNSGQLSLGQDPINYYWSLGRENITNGSFQIIQKDISYTGSSSEIVRLHIDGPTGNIGIGTTGPDVKLTINTADNYLTTGIYAKFQGLSNQRGLEFGQLFNGVNDSSGYIQSRQDSTTVQSLLINPYGGNVGIGTTNPFYKLDLTVAAVANSTYNFGSNSSVKSNISSTGTYYTNAISTDISNYILGSGVTNSGYAIAANTNAYIDSPNFKGTLAVNTGIQAKAGFYTAGAGAKINNVYAGYFMMLNNSTNGTITNAYGVYIDNSQTTGTITNRYGLYQNGSSAINYFDGSVVIGTLAGSGNRPVYSDASGTLTNTTSDSRLKKNIDTISSKIDVLDSLSKLRGVYYNWDTSVDAVKNLGDQREIGMIAQEVELVLPELVGTNATGYKSLDYSKMTGFLVEVSKAQQVLIDELNLKLGGIEDMSKPNIFRTAITSWFANAGNMIGDFYANRVRTKEICVSNDSGETCINRDKLDNLMASVEGSGGDGGGGEADTTAPVIILTGDALINIAKDEAYTEPGFTADDNIDGNITTTVVVGGDTVDIAVSAIYTITYNVFDAAGNNAAEVTRKVNVGEYVAPEADTTAPVISLNGESEIILIVGDSYTETATATDDVDGDITANITTGGNFVGTAIAGSYTITYNVSDTAGNSAAEVTRNIVVNN